MKMKSKLNVLDKEVLPDCLIRLCARPLAESSSTIGQIVEQRPFDWLS